MFHTRIGRLVLATGAVTAMVVAGIGTRAHADHDLPPGEGWAHWKSEQGADYAGVNTTKKYIGACDLERDGNGVYAQYRLAGALNIYRVDDDNGSQAGCGTKRVARNIIEFRACENDIGRDTCGPWEPIP